MRLARADGAPAGAPPPHTLSSSCFFAAASSERSRSPTGRPASSRTNRHGSSTPWTEPPTLSTGKTRPVERIVTGWVQSPSSKGASCLLQIPVRGRVNRLCCQQGGIRTALARSRVVFLACDSRELNIPCVQLEFGVVYSCLEDKMYKARRGKGAFCNDEPIQVSDVEGRLCFSDS